MGFTYYKTTRLHCYKNISPFTTSSDNLSQTTVVKKYTFSKLFYLKNVFLVNILLYLSKIKIDGIT